MLPLPLKTVPLKKVSSDAASENIADEKDNVSSPHPLCPVDRPTLNIQKITGNKKKIEEMSDSKTVENGPATLTSGIDPTQSHLSPLGSGSNNMTYIKEIDEIGMIHQRKKIIDDQRKRDREEFDIR